jgi:hypothetical protein
MCRDRDTEGTKDMIRYAFALTIALGAIAGVAAAMEATAAKSLHAAANQTVVEKNSPFPVIGPIVVEECIKDDCSDLTS